MVYSSGSAVREDISGPAPGRSCLRGLPNGETVVVNADFVPNTMQDRAQQDRAVAQLVTGAPVTLTGYIHLPEIRGHADAGGKHRPSGCGSRATAMTRADSMRQTASMVRWVA